MHKSIITSKTEFVRTKVKVSTQFGPKAKMGSHHALGWAPHAAGIRMIYVVAHEMTQAISIQLTILKARPRKRRR